MSEAADPEYCECGVLMDRVYTAPQVSVPMMGYYNHGLGRYIGHKSHIKDAIKEIAEPKKMERYNKMTGKTEKYERPGVNVVEVGNEKVKPKREDPQVKIPREVMNRLVKE